MLLKPTFYLAKFSQVVIKRFGRGGGTAFPGLLAERLHRALLPILASQLKGTIVVCGTNGKTTTSRLIASFLEGSGATVVHNRTGSNLIRGLLSTLIARADWRMKIKADWGLFEVDEAVFGQVIELLKPQYVVALNLFRDQLDRYGEVDALAAKWRTAIAQLPETATIIFNADDPLIASLGLSARAAIVPFGLTTHQHTRLPSHADSRRCPVCGRMLAFGEVAYSHLGHYACPNHDFQRPEPQVTADEIQLRGMVGSEFRIQIGTAELPFKLGLAGLYNIYNVTAAVALAANLHLDMAMVQERTSNFEAVFGRLEEVTIGSTRLTLILVKNPTGFNQVLQTLTTEPTAGYMWLILNDRLADGRDISWIWDVDLEQIVPQTKQLLTSGTRAADMALRAKYAGVDTSRLRVTPGLAEGLRTIAGSRQPEVYCLCTYTAMLGLRQLLQKQRAVESYHRE